MAGRTLGERAFIGLQYLLAAALPVAARRHGWRPAASVSCARALIRAFLGHYPVDLAEAARSSPADYASFNDFFTRRLRAGRAAFRCGPARGALPGRRHREPGRPHRGRHAVAGQGHRLLGRGAAGRRRSARGGIRGRRHSRRSTLRPTTTIACTCRSPGRSRIARFIPGDLFSVNAATAAGVPGLFARNERIACVFDTAAGPLAVVLVGALFVGSMSLAWSGRIRARARRAAARPAGRDPLIALDRGAELGWFNMGSTVVVLFAPQAVRLSSTALPPAARCASASRSDSLR